MRLLDAFCGAGGAAMGYHRAGFEIVGVDIKPQPRYPFIFIRGDAPEYIRNHGHEFDVIHASPPCQRWSECTPIAARNSHPDLIAVTRSAIGTTPYVIENVEGARHTLRFPFRLCGTMFGLNVWRHRWFESNAPIPSISPFCAHSGSPICVTGSHHGRGEVAPSVMIEALGVPWMRVRSEVRQAIPPAYTEFIGRQLIAGLA